MYGPRASTRSGTTGEPSKYASLASRTSASSSTPLKKRGWVATIKPDARRLLFGVTFDIPAGEDHEGLALFVSVRAMNATLRALKKTYPEVTQEFNALLAADGEPWQSAAPPRWRQTHAP